MKNECILCIRQNPGIHTVYFPCFLLPSKTSYHKEDKTSMPNTQNGTLSQPQSKGLNANFLKLFAALTMLVDHAAIALVYTKLKLVPDFSIFWELVHSKEATNEQLASISPEFSSLFTLYQTMRLVGRIAFPIFCFLIYEGFCHTKNIKKYLLRLLACAIVAELPFNLLTSGCFAEKTSLFYPQLQNTVWTLLISLLMLCGMKFFEAKDFSIRASILQMLSQFALIVIACLAAVLLKTDYSYYGPLLIAVFYLCRKDRKLQILLGCILFLSLDLAHLFAFIPIAMYNGERISSKKFSSFFYIFYPAHLLVLYLLSLLS